MKDKKTLKNEKAQDAEKKVNETMEELDENALSEVGGAGNPFGNVPRVPTQKIDSKVRNNG